MSATSRGARFLRLIRFEHTLFALPYAVAGAFLAAGGWPELASFLWILVAMVGARTAAMTFNRLVDRRFDATNPRTRTRASVTGELGVGFLWSMTVLSSALFVLAAAQLNHLAFLLSFPTLAVLLFYSVTKRFLSGTHFVLGVALGLSPLGAWVAIRGSLDDAGPALALGVAVLFWTAGFDILYSCQDVDHDRGAGLHSVPERLGIPAALRVAQGAHLVVPIALAAVGLAAGLGAVYFTSVVIVTALLVYEHRLVQPDDLSRVNQAFFTVNVVIGLLVMVGTLADVLLGGAAT